MSYGPQSNYFDNMHQNTQPQALLSPPTSPGANHNFGYTSSTSSSSSLGSSSSGVQHTAEWLFDSWGNLPSDAPVPAPSSSRKASANPKSSRQNLVYGGRDASSSQELTPRQIRHQLIYGTTHAPQPVQNQQPLFDMGTMNYPTQQPQTASWDSLVERKHLSSEPYSAALNSNGWRS